MQVYSSRKFEEAKGMIRKKWKYPIENDTNWGVKETLILKSEDSQRDLWNATKKNKSYIIKEQEGIEM